MRDRIRNAVLLTISIAVLTLAAMIPAPVGGAEQTMTPADSSSSQRKAEVLRDVMRKFGSGQKIDPAEFQEFVKAQNDGLMSGPAIGEPVPDFRLPDENGKDWSLNDLMGQKGLLLVFTRSADW
ncbi:MAG TPA: hypothetical protein VIX59_04025 [Candidatus Binataceae bacterium]